MATTFEYPGFLLLIFLGVPLVFLKLVHQKGAIGFSANALLEGVKLRFPFLLIERLCLSFFVVAFVLVLARPVELVRTAVPIYQEARDIAIVLDISGSMEAVNIHTARRVIVDFVNGRPQDRLALFVFHTVAFMEWPLSSDHQPLIYRVEHIRTEGGTKISTGLIAGLEHLAEIGQHSRALIMVSDGSSELKPEEKSAIENALEETKLYWIWIGPENDILSQAFGDYIRDLGGLVFRGGVEDLDMIFTEISTLEAAPVVWEQRITTVYHYGLLPLAALINLLVAAVVHRFREV